MEQVYEPPSNVVWFQRQLDRITKDKGIRLRIAWSPRLTVARFIDDDGIERVYQKYPLRFGSFAQFHIGDRYFRRVAGNLVPVAYQKTGDNLPLSILPGDIAQADIQTVNYAYHLWVIERKLPDDVAKAIHEEKRGHALLHLGRDIFGSFPAEGIWDFCGFVSSHSYVMQPWGTEMSCCEIAGEQGVTCEGLYREPNGRDLDAVRAMVKQWEMVEAKKDKTGLIEQHARDRERELKASHEFALIDIMKEATECEALDIIAHNRSRVALGTNAPRHRTEY